MSLRDRLPSLLQLRREHLLSLRSNAEDKTKDLTGTGTMSVHGTIRFIGVAAFVVEDDVDSFRCCLAECAQLRLSLFRRAAAGEPIDESYLSILAYKDVLNALAAGKTVDAERLSQHLGGRADVDEQISSDFDRYFGLALRASVLSSSVDATNSIEEFGDYCARAEETDFRGYADAFSGIMNREGKGVSQALDSIVKGHVRQTKRGGVFNGVEDEVLCVWGVGVANLAIRAGQDVASTSSWIPEKLIVRAPVAE